MTLTSSGCGCSPVLWMSQGQTNSKRKTQGSGGSFPHTHTQCSLTDKAVLFCVLAQGSVSVYKENRNLTSKWKPLFLNTSGGPRRKAPTQLSFPLTSRGVRGRITLEVDAEFNHSHFIINSLSCHTRQWVLLGHFLHRYRHMLFLFCLFPPWPSPTLSPPLPPSTEPSPCFPITRVRYPLSLPLGSLKSPSTLCPAHTHTGTHTCIHMYTHVHMHTQTYTPSRVLK